MLDVLPMFVLVWLLLARYLRENFGPRTTDAFGIRIVTQNGFLQYTLCLFWCWLARLITHSSRTLLHSMLRQAERRNGSLLKGLRSSSDAAKKALRQALPGLAGSTFNPECRRNLILGLCKVHKDHLLD